MITLLSKFYWRLFGWKITGTLPKELQQMILVIAPHTNWTDLFIGFAARHYLKIPHAKLLAKKELFDGVFGKWLIKLGGIPVDRSGKLGLVDQVVNYFNKNDKFIIGLSPEGTRKRVDKLKTGFYHMAKNANVPIVLIGFDYKNKRVIIGETIYPSASEENDFKKIISFFSSIEGAKPQYDLRHLKES
ncbi:MAG TPA: 1-acyl-sn-glycerol-3-phosphate acyltransferase [Brumimicrobium sp.]|nr:1-acyl-sn-glycerol-3-phosphate acyltransferase [Brumimicrobium sp.]